MSRTVAETSAAYRKRRAAKVARYEAALREIVARSDNEQSGDDDWSFGYVAGIETVASIAREALGGR